MSQTEIHVGKLRKVDTGNLTVEEWCENKCKEQGRNEISSYNNSWTEEFRSTSHEKYFFTESEIWEAFEHIEGDDGDDIYHMQKNEDGTISFVMRFYNGGTCLTECIEEGLEKIDQQK
jgi:hypothetical protein